MSFWGTPKTYLFQYSIVHAEEGRSNSGLRIAVLLYYTTLLILHSKNTPDTEEKQKQK